MKSINLLLKKIFDYLLAVGLVIILLIPMIMIYFMVSFFDGKPVFFIQKRAGINGRVIKIVKFKTLIEIKNKKKIVTKLGRFLRLTRIDEIPQLFNVIRGDLSFVGPRPLYSKYIKLYNKYQKRRLDMKPGITGWAQVNGDNNISWKKKFELDIWYINNFNFFLDIKIIFLTFIFFLKGIFFYKKNKDTKIIIDEEFNGKN